MLACLAGMLAAALPAQAQLLNSYFPPTGGGAGGIPADSSAARVAKEYESSGITSGSFVIRPEVSETLGYASNANGVTGSSPVIDTAGSVIIRSNWVDTNVSGQFTVNDQRYPSQSSQDQTSWTASLGATQAIGHDILGIGYNHLSLVETPNQIGSVGIQTVPYQVDIVSLSDTIATHSRFSFIPNVTVTRFNFDPVPIAGTPDTNATRDRTVLQAGLTTRYQLSPATDALLVLNTTEIWYDNTQPAIAGLNSNGATILVGIDSRSGGPFSYRLLVGYQERVFRSSLYGSAGGPIFEGVVIWRPTRLTTVTATVRRDIDDSQSQGLAGYTYLGGSLRIEHELRRNITIGAFISVERADSQISAAAAAAIPFEGTVSSRSDAAVGATARWLLNRNMSLDWAVQYSSQQNVGSRNDNGATALMTLRFHL